VRHSPADDSATRRLGDTNGNDTNGNGNGNGKKPRWVGQTATGSVRA